MEIDTAKLLYQWEEQVLFIERVNIPAESHACYLKSR
jgi:hypothetical protein